MLELEVSLHAYNAYIFRLCPHHNNSIQNLSLDSLWIVVDKIQRCGPSIDDV